MAGKGKKERISVEADASPLGIPLGALLGRETPPEDPPAGKVRPEAVPSTAEGKLPGRAVLSRETKGRGGKTVTRISFRDGTPPDTAALAKSLRTAMGCGGTVEGDDILLQGDQIERTAEWFAARRVKVTRAH
jgi:translation initiation factor 1